MCVKVPRVFSTESIVKNILESLAVPLVTYGVQVVVMGLLPE